MRDLFIYIIHTWIVTAYEKKEWNTWTFDIVWLTWVTKNNTNKERMCIKILKQSEVGEIMDDVVPTPQHSYFCVISN